MSQKFWATLRPFLLVILLCGLSSPAMAENSDNAKVFIQKIGDQVVDILGNKTITPEARNAKLRAMMRESFDLPTIGRFVIGRSWLQATEAQRKEYMQLFEKLVISIYSDRFSLYSGEKMTAKDTRNEGERDVMVTSEIFNPDNPTKPVTVDWRVRNFNGRLGIIDVAVEGVSMSLTQRQEYQSVIQRHGGEIQPLLDLMRERLAKVDAG